ncbi:MAG: hypothetical protein ACKO7N_02340 [Candidatus Nitrosotenuis sp.]
MTAYFKRIYDLHLESKLQAEIQLKKAEEMLSNNVEWDNKGAETLKKASLIRIKQTNKFIEDLLKKCDKYVKEGRINKFW